MERCAKIGSANCHDGIRALRKRLLRSFIKSHPTRLTVETAIDSHCDAHEVARVGKFIQAVRLPEQRRGATRKHRLREQLGFVFQSYAQIPSARVIVRSPCDLNEPASAVTKAVSRLRIPEFTRSLSRRLIGPLFVGRAPQFLYPLELTRFVRDLGDEGGLAGGSIDLELVHRCIQRIQKHVSAPAGVRHDYEQLISRHIHSQTVPRPVLLAAPTPRIATQVDRKQPFLKSPLPYALPQEISKSLRADLYCGLGTLVLPSHAADEFLFKSRVIRLRFEISPES